MAYKVILVEEVEREVEEVILWYEEQQKGLGDRFYSILVEKMELLKDVPQYHSYIYPEYRRVAIRPFPFSIIYKIYGSTVVVLAVWHQSKNPAELLKRIN